MDRTRRFQPLREQLLHLRRRVVQIRDALLRISASTSSPVPMPSMFSASNVGDNPVAPVDVINWSYFFDTRGRTTDETAQAGRRSMR